MSSQNESPVIELKVRIHPLADGEFLHRVQIIGDTDISNSPYMKTMQVDNLAPVFDAQIEAIEHIRETLVNPPDATEISGRLKATELPQPIYELVALAQADDIDTDAIQQVADRICFAAEESATSDVTPSTDSESDTGDEEPVIDSDEAASSPEDTSETDLPEQDADRSPGGYWLTDTDDNRLRLNDIVDRLDDGLQKRLQSSPDLTFTSLDKAEQTVSDISQALQEPLQLWRNEKKYKRIEPTDDSSEDAPAKTVSEKRIPPKTFQPPFVLVSDDSTLLKDGQEYESKGGAARGASAQASSEAITVHVVSRPTGKVYKTYSVTGINDSGEPAVDVIDRPGKTFDLPLSDEVPDTQDESASGNAVMLFQDGTRRIMKASDPVEVQNARMDNQMFLFGTADEARQVARALASHDDEAVTLRSDSLTETVQPE